jgi:hypothetical protein
MSTGCDYQLGLRQHSLSESMIETALAPGLTVYYGWLCAASGERNRTHHTFKAVNKIWSSESTVAPVAMNSALLPLVCLSM